MANAINLVIGYLLDLLLGDPQWMPHPIRLFGWLIDKGERLLNRPPAVFLKGMVLSLTLCTATYFCCRGILSIGAVLPGDAVLPGGPVPPGGIFPLLPGAIAVFFGLANRQLIVEGRKVFSVLRTDGLGPAREQLSRIVGRDTRNLTDQQVRIAVLETMSENLGDGVVAPLFYFAIGGVPGMLTYKMINTLDSMIGYRNERYERFGKFAARMDDVANFIPARLTALLMVIITGSGRGARFALRYGHLHKSPNAGYPEAALAGILDCRFGGPNVYHGVLVDKPYIGENNRAIGPEEINKVSRINNGVCLLMVVLIVLVKCL